MNKEYISKIIKGDEKAFEYMYKEYYNKIYILSLTILKNEVDAYDVTQEVFIEIYKSLKNLKDYKKFDYWINKIVISKCSKLIKKNRNMVLVGNDVEIFEDVKNEDLDLSNIIIKSEMQMKILEIINKLSTKKQIVIVLYYYNELKIKEISKLLKCSEGTVKSRLNSARKEIRSMLDKKEIKNYVISNIDILNNIKELNFKKINLKEIIEFSKNGYSNTLLNKINILFNSVSMNNIFYVLFLTNTLINYNLDYKELFINNDYVKKYYYSVEDSKGNKNDKLRIVTIKKDLAPKIIGVNNKTIKLGEKFDKLEGVYVEDDFDINIKSSVIGEVDGNKLGRYTIKYIAEDSKGNKTVKYRIINVI